MEFSGAQILLQCLKKLEADTVFGFPGGSVIPLYDALYDVKSDFKHLLTAHEQGAVHAADGYARASGKVGVVFVTSGPGATNTITGIATAYMDSIPMVVITGQVPAPLLGKDSFQEVDITGITMPITKHNFIVRDVKYLASTVFKAFCIAKSGRPGPVLIDIPKNIFTNKIEFNINNISDKDHDSFICPADKFADEQTLKKIAELINTSKKPVIYAGGGIKIADADKELFCLATKSRIPVVSTLMGLGAFPRTQELSLGIVGMHGFPCANLAVMNSDLVLAVGSRFSDRVTGDPSKFANSAKIIHIDIDRTEMSKNKDTDINVYGNVKHILKKLCELTNQNSRTDWINEIETFKSKVKENKKSFTPKNILNTACEIANPDNTVVCTDVGQHQLWTAQHWKFTKTKSFLSSGGLGTMGFGLGAAIGAKTASPDKNVVLVTGDGSFRMNCHELATVSAYNIPVVILLFNNGVLGMVRQWQRLFQNKKYSETTLNQNLDYVKLAKAYRISASRTNSISKFQKLFKKAIKSNKPVLIECIINKDEGVYPIVPPGKSIDQLILSGDLE